MISILGTIADVDLNNVIEFTVSDEKILTLKNLVRNNKARYTKHNVQGKKPISVFDGADLDTISFEMTLMAQNGVNPKKEMNKLIVLQRNGDLVALMIGDTMFGMYRWVITDLSNNFDIIDNMGNFLGITINISLEEYI